MVLLHVHRVLKASKSAGLPSQQKPAAVRFLGMSLLEQDASLLVVPVSAAWKKADKKKAVWHCGRAVQNGVIGGCQDVKALRQRCWYCCRFCPQRQSDPCYGLG